METQPQVLEAEITSLWSRILQTTIGPDDDFFESGGDSLAAMQMIMEVQELYGVMLDPVEVLDHPTAGAFSRLLDEVLANAQARPDAG